MPRTRIAAFALCGWTLFVWTTRIGNIWRDDAASTASKLGSTALALSFTVLAVAVGIAAWRRVASALRPAVLALAGWTTGVWVVRSLTILAGDRSAGFKVVHGLLAVVSIGLAAWAVRTVHPGTAGSDDPSDDLSRSAASQRA
jgi:hypothetical protein